MKENQSQTAGLPVSEVLKDAFGLCVAILGLGKPLVYQRGTNDDFTL